MRPHSNTSKNSTPGDYSRVATSTIAPSGIDYEVGIEVEVGEHTENIPLVKDSDCREEDNPPIAWVHERRGEYYSQLGRHPPPDGMDSGREILDEGYPRAPERREDWRLVQPPPSSKISLTESMPSGGG